MEWSERDPSRLLKIAVMWCGVECYDSELIRGGSSVRKLKWSVCMDIVAQVACLCGACNGCVARRKRLCVGSCWRWATAASKQVTQAKLSECVRWEVCMFHCVSYARLPK